MVFLGGLYLFGANRGGPNPTESLNMEIQKESPGLRFSPFYFRPAVDKIGGQGGYEYKHASMVAGPELLSFQLVNSKGHTVQVTQQARPAEFDISSQPGRTVLNVATGRAVIGQNDKSTTAAIFGEKTMLFIKAQQIVDDDSLRAMMSAFATE